MLVSTKPSLYSAHLGRYHGVNLSPKNRWGWLYELYPTATWLLDICDDKIPPDIDHNICCLKLYYLHESVVRLQPTGTIGPQPNRDRGDNRVPFVTVQLFHVLESALQTSFASRGNRT